MDNNSTRTEPNAERWLPVLGYEGLYEISDKGRVRTVARTTVGRDGAHYPVKARIRKATKQVRRQGHLALTLSGKGKIRLRYIHRMVLEAFVGPCPPGMQGCHNDGNVDNNTLENLRWDTPAGNAADKQKHGTDHQRNKTHCPYGHSLQLPNLVKSTWKRGHRHCLACSRTRAHMQRNPHDKPNYQIISDQYLQQIMAP